MKIQIGSDILSWLLLGALLSTPGLTLAHDEEKGRPLTATEKPRELEGVGIQEHLGTKLDLSLPVRNEQGEVLPLSTYFNGSQPVILSLVYYDCPGLCNFHLNGVLQTLKEMDWSIGEKFQVVALSFDSREGADLAAQKKETYLKQYGRTGAAKGWHFLTADEPTVKALSSQVGFQFKWNDEEKQWAHASAAIVTTPDGKISRYLHGIQFSKQDFKLALTEATEGRIGSLMERMVWYCFKYDPHQSKYTIYSFRLLQLVGALFVLMMAVMLVPYWIRIRRGSV